MMKGAIVTFTDLKNVIEKLTIKNVEVSTYRIV